MSKPFITRIVLTVVGIVLVIFLYRLPKYVVEDQKVIAETGSNKEPDKNVAQATAGDGHEISQKSQKELARLRKSYLLSKESAGSSEKTLIFADSLAGLYVDNFLFDSATIVLEEVLTLDNQPVRLYLAGKEFLRMCKIVSSSDAQKSASYGERAIALFEKTLELQPDLTSAAVNKAVAIVYRNTSQRKPPVEGIMLLKELIEKYPQLTEARMSLGELYAQRGQLESEWLAKGVEQFSAVLAYEPENTTALMYLVESHIRLGEDAKASQHLQTLKKINQVLNDPFLTDMINRYEKELKS